MKQSIKERLAAFQNDEIPERYKRTNYGIIPTEWELKKLSDLIRDKYIIDHLDGNHGSLYPKNDEFSDGGVPYISANSIVNGRIDFKISKFLKEERANQFRKGVAKDQDVLFAHNATVGPVALLETNLKKVILSTTLTYYRCNKEYILPRYLMQYMQSRYFCVQYESIMAQSTRNQVPITTQRELYHIVPPLPEQQKIAEILSAWDKAIELKTQLIEEKKKQKKGLIKKLLTGEVRLSGFKGEWEVVRLGALIKNKTKKTTLNNQYIVLSCTKDGIVSQSEHFNKQIASENNIGYKILQRGELVLSPMNLWLGGIDISCFDIGIVSPAYKVYTVDYSLVGENYLRNLLRSDYMIRRYDSISQKGASVVRRNLSITDFENVPINIPMDKFEMDAIDDVIGLASREIELLEQDLANHKIQKKGLMQLLLTGIVRVRC